MLRVELGTDRIRPEGGGDRRVAIVKLHGGQRTRIIEHDARTVVELEDEPGESRQRITSRNDYPITGHSEVNVQRGPVVEDGELMLPASLDPSDRSSRETTQTRGTNPTSDMRMKDSGAHDPHTGRSALERARRVLDFRKLRHEGQRMQTPDGAQAHAIDSGARPRRL